MGDVVDLRAHRASRELSTRSVAELHRIVDELLRLATQLALAGPWAAWADSRPIGSEVSISEDDLRDCGDAGVLGVLLARDAVLLAISALGGDER